MLPPTNAAVRRLRGRRGLHIQSRMLLSYLSGVCCRSQGTSVSRLPSAFMVWILQLCNFAVFAIGAPHELAEHRRGTGLPDMVKRSTFCRMPRLLVSLPGQRRKPTSSRRRLHGVCVFARLQRCTQLCRGSQEAFESFDSQRSEVKAGFPAPSSPQWTMTCIRALSRMSWHAMRSCSLWRKRARQEGCMLRARYMQVLPLADTPQIYLRDVRYLDRPHG